MGDKMRGGRRKKITISYSWKNHKDANIIDNYFFNIGYRLLIDQRDLKYGSRITDFADEMRRCDYYVCLISDYYLKSYYCMREMINFSYEQDFLDKKFCPIVISEGEDAADFSDEGIEKYDEYWEQKFAKEKKIYEQKLSENGFRNTTRRQKYVSDLEEIKQTIDEFLLMVRDVYRVKMEDIREKGSKALEDTVFSKAGIESKIAATELMEIAEKDNLVEAERKISKYPLDIQLNNAYVIYTKAAVYEKCGYEDLALYYYQLATEKKKDYVVAYEAIIFQRLRIALNTKNVSDSLEKDDVFKKACKDLTKLGDDSYMVKIADAITKFTTNDFQKVIAILEPIVKLCPFSWQAYIYKMIANSYEKIYEKEPSDEALKKITEAYDMAMAINPNYYQAYNDVAIVYLNKVKNLKKAREYIKKCIEIKPDFCMAYNTSGLIYEEEKNFEKALSEYLKACSLKTGYTAPYTQIGRILDYECNSKICKPYYEWAYENSVSLPNLFNLGNYYRKYTDDNDKAYEYLKKAYDIWPKNILCPMAMGLLEYKKKDYIAALKFFKEALKIRENFEPAQFYVVLCQYDQDDTPYYPDNRYLKSFSYDGKKYQMPDRDGMEIKRITDLIEHEYTLNPEDSVIKRNITVVNRPTS